MISDLRCEIFLGTAIGGDWHKVASNFPRKCDNLEPPPWEAVKPYFQPWGEGAPVPMNCAPYGQDVNNVFLVDVFHRPWSVISCDISKFMFRIGWLKLLDYLVLSHKDQLNITPCHFLELLCTPWVRSWLSIWQTLATIADSWRLRVKSSTYHSWLTLSWEVEINYLSNIVDKQRIILL